jgi:hypothetical protein
LEWDQQGLITIQGMAPRARVLQVGKGIKLVRLRFVV